MLPASMPASAIRAELAMKLPQRPVPAAGPPMAWAARGAQVRGESPP